MELLLHIESSWKIGSVFVKPFNSSKRFLLGTVGAMKEALGSFGIWMEDLTLFEDDDEQKEEESIDETCKEAIGYLRYVLCALICI